MTIAGQLLLPVLPDTKGFGKDLVKDLDREVDKSESKLNKSFGKIGLFAKASLAAAGVAAGAALMKGLGDAISNEQVDDKLAASLNLSGADAAKAGRVTGSLYVQAFGESYGEVSGVVGSVVASFGELNEADLSAISAGALTIADVFGVDVQEAILSAGIAVETGLAQDGVHAMDLFTTALQTVPVALRGDLISAVEEYGDELAGFGLTGEQAFAVLADAASGGRIELDKIPDSLKELALKGTDMSKLTVEAYEAAGLSAEEMAAKLLEGGPAATEATAQIAEGLLGIKDPVERSNAAIALFGTPLEDLSVTDIPDFLESLKSMDEGFGDVTGATKEAGDTAYDNFGTKLTELKRGGMKEFSDFLDVTMLPVLNRVIDGAKNFGVGFQTVVAAAQPAIVQVKGAFETAMLVVSKVREGIASASTVINGALGSTGGKASWLSERFQAVWAQIQTKVLDRLAPLFQAAFGAVQALVTTVTKVVTNLWDRFGSDLIAKAKTALNIIRETFTKVFQSILDIFDGVLQTITGVFDTFAAIFRGDWQGFLDGLAKIWDGLWRTVTAILRGAFEVIRGMFRASINALSLLWEAFSDGLRAVFGLLWNALGTAAKAGWQNLKDQWTQSVARVKEIWANYTADLRAEWDAFWLAIRTVLTAAWTAVKDTFASYIAGLVGEWDTFTGRIRDVWTGMWDAVRTAFSDKWAALRGSIDTATNLLVGMWLGFTDRIKTGWTTLWDGIKTGFGKIRSGMESMVTGLVDSLRNIWDGIRNVLSAPIRWVQDKVINGFIGAVNKVSNALGGGDILAPIALVPEYHTGGVVGAPGARMRDLVRSPLKSDEEMSVLRKGERVQTAQQAKNEEPTERPGGSFLGGGSVGDRDGAIVAIPGMPGELVHRNILAATLDIIERFKVRITDGYATSGHKASGEHPLGIALDIVPGAGGSWDLVDQLAYAAEPKQGEPVHPFKWVGYDGDKNHGRGHHLHLSWKRSFLDSSDGGGAPSGGGEGGGVFDFVGQLIKKFISPITGLLDEIPGSKVVGGMLKSVGTKLIDQGIQYVRDTLGFGGGGGGGDGSIAQIILAVAKGVGASARAILASFETALVESGMQNLNYGDRDSLGVFQQRAAWGSAADRMNPAWAALHFFQGGEGGQRGALHYDAKGKDYRGRQINTAGQLAQATQVSAFPDRYDERESEARSILRSLGASYDRGGLLQPGFTSAFNGTGQPELVTAMDVLDDALDRAAGRNGGGPILNIENYAAHEKADLDALTDRIAFRLEPVLG